MQLVVVRHARAEERSDFLRHTNDDSLRPLTDDGRERMRSVAKGLRRLVPKVDRLFSSTLVRAFQTAEIISFEYKNMGFDQVSTLAPGFDRNETLKWLKQFEGEKTVMIVGHEPDLSEFVSYLLSGNSSPFVSLKKGGACRLDFEGVVRARGAQLAWYMDPSILRRIE